jgi:hypothetical protein
MPSRLTCHAAKVPVPVIAVTFAIITPVAFV